MSVMTPDNAVVNTYYSGNQVLVQDQAGKERMSQTNALGQLTDVWEITPADQWTVSVSFPNHPEVTSGYRTTYGYDCLDDLTSVTQAPQPARTFNYDSLKRLVSATNPESGTVSYQYDENGNLRVKTDARGASAHSEYDALNRVTRRWYNGSSSLTATINNSPALPSSVAATDEVKYFYDSRLPSDAPPNFTPAFATGRLSAVTYGGGSLGDYYSYDAMSRVTTKYQQTGGINYKVGPVIYNLAGNITSETYPSGHTVSYNYDSAGRMADKDAQNLAFTGTLGDGALRTYATGISYSVFGGAQEEKFGTTTAVYNKRHYNLRGQLYDIRASTIPWATDQWNWNRGAVVNYYSSNYSWGGNSSGSGPDNNGNVTRQQHWVPADESLSNYSYTQDTFSYDSLNRLSSISELHGTPSSQSATDFVQAYSYDCFGNRRINTALTWVQGLTTPRAGSIQTITVFTHRAIRTSRIPSSA